MIYANSRPISTFTDDTEKQLKGPFYATNLQH